MQRRTRLTKRTKSSNYSMIVQLAWFNIGYSPLWSLCYGSPTSHQEFSKTSKLLHKIAFSICLVLSFWLFPINWMCSSSSTSLNFTLILIIRSWSRVCWVALKTNHLIGLPIPQNGSLTWSIWTPRWRDAIDTVSLHKCSLLSVSPACSCTSSSLASLPLSHQAIMSSSTLSSPLSPSFGFSSSWALKSCSLNLCIALIFGTIKLSIG